MRYLLLKGIPTASHIKAPHLDRVIVGRRNISSMLSDYRSQLHCSSTALSVCALLLIMKRPSTAFFSIHIIRYIPHVLPKKTVASHMLNCLMRMVVCGWGDTWKVEKVSCSGNAHSTYTKWHALPDSSHIAGNIRCHNRRV